MSHKLIVWSPLPEASVLPSGLCATQFTGPVCPLRVSRSLGSWADNGDGSSPRKATPSQAATRCPRSTFGVITHLRLVVSLPHLHNSAGHFYPCPARLPRQFPQTPDQTRGDTTAP